MEGPGDGQQGDADAGVVIGSVENRIQSRHASFCRRRISGYISYSIMIVMATEEDIFFAEDRVFTILDPDDVDRGIFEVFDMQLCLQAQAGSLYQAEGGRVEPEN